MPLGAFRLNGLGKVQVSAAVTYPVVTSTVATDFTHPYIDYSRSTVCYVGPDTSNRPVFAVASGSSNNLRVTLFRINTDTTITEGSVQTTAVTGIQQQVSMASEYEDANVNGAGSGDYIYMVYNITGTSYVRAASVSRDALTVTFGTAVSLALTPDANQNYVAYVGNSRCVAGARTGSGSVAKRYSRSGTTLTSEGTATGDMGFRIDSDLIGFLNNGTTQYRYGWFNTNSGASGTHYGAGEMGATNYLASNTSIASSGYDQGSTLNNYNKMIGLNQIGGTWYVRAISITWNAASAATLSAGSSQSFTDVTGSGGQAFVINGHQFDEAYVLYASSSSTIDYRRITVDGTTTTLGSKVTGVTGLSSLYYQLSAAAAQIGLNRWIAGYYVRSSGNPYLFAMKLEPYNTRTAITITANGNAQLDTAQSQIGGSSALFDGTGDYLSGDLSVLANTSDFTLEFWVRFAALPTSGNFSMIWGTTSANQYFGLWNSSGSYRIAIAVTGSDGTYYADWSTTAATNTWYHYAMTKSGSTIAVYRDGTALTSPTTTGTMTANKGIAGGTSYIGRWSNATSYQLNGWVDELRLSKISRYGGNFITSTTPFINDSNTCLLIHSDGKDAGTSFFDDNGVDRSRRDFIANFNAQISTAQSVFGGASALFDGSGDYISNLLIPAFGTSDFTVECRIRFTAATATGVIFDARGSSGNSSGFCVYVNSSAIRLYHTASDRIISSTISLNTWYHLAITRSGNDHKMWLDGTQTGSTWTNAASWTIGSATSGFWIGDNQPFPNVGQGFNGYMDEMRISSACRYTTTFTPSSTAFTNDANTVCLLHMDGSNATTVFNDDNASY